MRRTLLFSTVTMLMIAFGANLSTAQAEDDRRGEQTPLEIEREKFFDTYPNIYNRNFLVRYEPEYLTLTNTIVILALDEKMISRAFDKLKKDNLDLPNDCISFDYYGPRGFAGGGGGGALFGNEKPLVQVSLFEESGLPDNTKFCILNFRYKKDISEADAEKIGLALIEEVRSKWNEVQLAPQQNELKQQRTILAAYRDAKEQLQEELDKRLSASAKIETHLIGYSSEAVLQEELQLVDRSAREAKRREVGLKARKEKLESEMDSVRKQVEAKSNPVIDRLEKVLELRKQNLARFQMLLEKQSAPPASVDAARGEMLEAEMRLLEAKEAAANSSASPLLMTFNEELIRIAAELAEIEATDNVLAKQWEELRDNLQARLSGMRELERKTSEIDSLRKQIEQLDERIAEFNLLDMSQRMKPVTIRPL